MEAIALIIGLIIAAWIFSLIGEFLSSVRVDKKEEDIHWEQKFEIESAKHKKQTGQELTIEQFDADEERAWFVTKNAK